MRIVLILVLVVGVIAVVANDAGRLSNTKYDLGNATEKVVDEVAAHARNKSRDEAATMAAKLGAERGIRVYQYDQDPQGIRVWTETTVSGTWVLGRFRAWRSGKPLDTPYVIRDYATSVYR